MISLHSTEKGADSGGDVGDGKIARARDTRETPGSNERTNGGREGAIVRGEFDGNYRALPPSFTSILTCLYVRATAAVPANAVSNSHSYRNRREEPRGPFRRTGLS